MTHPFPARRSAAFVATVAASALFAAPALATEGPAAPPPAAQLPSGVAPITFAPPPSAGAPGSRARAARVIRRARLVPRRVRPGHRAQLRVWLATPSRLRIVIARANGRSMRVVNAPVSGRRVVLRLPSRAHGKTLRPGRYRVRVVAVDGLGTRSLPARLTLVVRRHAH